MNPPKATALHVLAGNPGHKRLTPDVPAASGIPEPPDFLTGIALEQWHRTVAVMREIGTLGAETREVLGLYCAAWARVAEAEAEIARAGAVVRSRLGGEIANPWIAIANQSATLVTRLATELGLTPASRARVAPANPSPKANPFLLAARGRPA
jgi:P27 family predicted phage terminase small subunit